MATTIAELQDTVDTIHEKALMTSRFTAIMAPLCWQIRKGKGHSTVNVPYFGTISANTLTEGVDLITDKIMADTNVPITLYEKGAKIILTDVALEDDREQLESIAGKLLGQANEKLRDEDLLGQLDDATSTVGASGSTVTMGFLAAGKAILSGNAEASGGPAPTPYVCVLHPYQTLDLVDVITPVGPTFESASFGYNSPNTSFADSALRTGMIGQLFGMAMYEDGNIAIDTTPDAKGGIFSPGQEGSIILATARDWQVEAERDNSLRGFELTCVGRYGVGEYLAGWMITVQSDAATPA